MGGMLTLYDASRCPYCARVRILLAEKQVQYEPVEIDLADRPAWLFEKNPLGKVPVLEEDDFSLPESRVIMEYVEESFPVPPLLPSDPPERARLRLWFERFDAFSSPYYRVVFEGGPVEELETALAKLDAAFRAGPYLVGSQYSLADIAYVPWIIRVKGRAGIDLDRYTNLSRWLARLSKRPAIASELEHASVAAR
jgi:glutathione S-transferase